VAICHGRVDCCSAASQHGSILDRSASRSTGRGGQPPSTKREATQATAPVKQGRLWSLTNHKIQSRTTWPAVGSLLKIDPKVSAAILGDEKIFLVKILSD